MRKSYPNYSYREATLNPTNLVDRADDWETDVIRYFPDHPERQEVVGERETPTGRQLYLAKPIRVSQLPGMPQHARCRASGDDQEIWQRQRLRLEPDQIIAAQIVSVPMSVPVSVADNAFHRLIFFLIATFLVTIVALDAGALSDGDSPAA